MIRGVCFDMDGLLIDSEPLGAKMMFKAVEEQGCNLTVEQQRSSLGMNADATKVAMRKWFGDAIDPEQYMSDWFRLMKEYIRENGVPEKTGAREALAALKVRGVRTALVTSNDPTLVNDYLRLSGFDAYLDFVVTGNQVVHGKPAPDIYLLAAEKLGLSPDECAGVDDSLNGVKAIRSAGMLSVMVPDLLPYGETFAPYVDICLDSLKELDAALQARA